MKNSSREEVILSLNLNILFKKLFKINSMFLIQKKNVLKLYISKRLFST